VSTPKQTVCDCEACRQLRSLRRRVPALPVTDTEKAHTASATLRAAAVELREAWLVLAETVSTAWHEVADAAREGVAELGAVFKEAMNREGNKQ
jgi:hypothetical protein